MLGVISFDPVDISDDTKKTLNFKEEEEAFSMNFEALGMESSNQIINAGVLNIVFVIVPLFLILVWLLSKCTVKCSKVNKFFGNLKERAYFNGIIRYLDAIFIPVLI